MYRLAANQFFYAVYNPRIFWIRAEEILSRAEEAARLHTAPTQQQPQRPASPYELWLITSKAEKAHDALKPIHDVIDAIAKPFVSLFPSRRKLEVSFEGNKIRMSFTPLRIKPQKYPDFNWGLTQYIGVSDVESETITYQRYRKTFIHHPGEVFKGGGQRLGYSEPGPDAIEQEGMTEADVIEWYKQTLAERVATHNIAKSRSRELLNQARSKLGLQSLFLAAALTASEGSQALQNNQFEDPTSDHEITLEL